MRKSKLFAWWYPSDPAYEEFKLVRHQGMWKLQSLETGLFHEWLRYDSRFKRNKMEKYLIQSGYHKVK